MVSPARAKEALELQEQRDQVVFSNLLMWRNGLELQRLQRLADDLQLLGILGLGDGVSIQDVQNEIDQALQAFLTSIELTAALASYVTSSALNTTLTNYVTSGQLADALYLYVTEEERAQDLATYVTNSALTSILTNYVTNGGLASQLSSFVTQTALNAALSTYVTSGALTTTLTNYVNNNALNSAIADFVTSSALTSALSAYVTSSALTSALSNYVTNASLSTNLQNYITSGALTAALANYVTSGALTTALANYVTSSALTTALSSYVTSTTLTSTLANYAKRGTTNTIAATCEAVNCINVTVNGTENVAINCKNVLINVLQKNATFINCNQVVLPRFPEFTVVKGATSNGYKRIVSETNITKVKVANSSVVIADSDGIKPVDVLGSVSGGYWSEHYIEISSNLSGGLLSRKRVIVGSQGISVYAEQTDIVVSNGSIGLVIAITQNGGLNIDVSLNGVYNSNQAEIDCKIKSYHYSPSF